MTFETQQLFETHKRKFCVGSTVDPARIHSRISGKGGNRNERKDRQELQMVSKVNKCSSDQNSWKVIGGGDPRDRVVSPQSYSHILAIL